MSYFSFLKFDDASKEFETFNQQGKDEVHQIGRQIVKLAESEDLENLEALCQEARPIMKFLKDYIYEAFNGVISLKFEDVVEFFLKNGISVKDKPLDESIMTLTKISKWTVNDPPVEVLALLLKYGADANYIESGKFRTPIIYACKQGNLPFVHILIENGADVNVTDKLNKMPLNYVNEKLKKYPDRGAYKQIQELLISKGAKDKW